MLPLRDLNPRRTVPVVNVLIILANIAIFLYQLSLGPRDGQQLVFLYGMIPARVPAAFGSHVVTLREAFLPLLTSMFLHGGLLHLLGNMWYLWLFGDNVEDHLGHAQYLMFYLICGVGAGIVHTAFNLSSRIPAVGASGAISGVMGAYIVLYPGARVLTWIPPIFILSLPSLIVLAIWFLQQFVSGIATLGLPNTSGVAFWAHIGGFVLGTALVWHSRRR